MSTTEQIHAARELGRKDYEQERPMRPPLAITEDGLIEQYLEGYRQAYRDSIVAAKASIATRRMAEYLMPGDVVPNAFGRLRRVTEIIGRGEVLAGPDKGKAYVCFVQAFGESSTMSNSIVEGRPMASFIASIDPKQFEHPVA